MPTELSTTMMTMMMMMMMQIIVHLSLKPAVICQIGIFILLSLLIINRIMIIPKRIT